MPNSIHSHTTFSLLDIFTAHRLDKNIARHVKKAKLFNKSIRKLANGCNQNHLKRKINHAIYHQAHPEKCLYLREFLQNALDAYARIDSQTVQNIPLYISTNNDNECVLSLTDKGSGMSAEDVFNFVVIPGSSSKRKADSKKFIGGRGVGLFTAFHNAKRIQLKTSTGNGETHYFVFTPVYKTFQNAEELVVDVNINWQTIAEDFQGSIIERVSDVYPPALESAKYQRAINTHARFIDGNFFHVTINDATVNKPLQPLAQFEVPELGTIKIYIYIN